MLNVKMQGRSASEKEKRQINFLKSVMSKALQAESVRIDHNDLLHQKPMMKDMFIDSHIATATIIHGLLLLISLGLMVLIMKPASVMLGGVAISSNVFGLTQSMYGGSVTKKGQKLDKALQKFAVIVAQFAKALKIQETYFNEMKKSLNELIRILDPFSRESKNLDIKARDTTNALTIIQSEVMHQHTLWLRAWFDQYHLLDNRAEIDQKEYSDFVEALPIESKKCLQELNKQRTEASTSRHSDRLSYYDLGALIERVIHSQSNLLRIKLTQIKTFFERVFFRDTEEKIDSGKFPKVENYRFLFNVGKKIKKIQRLIFSFCLVFILHSIYQFPSSLKVVLQLFSLNSRPDFHITLPFFAHCTTMTNQCKNSDKNKFTKYFLWKHQQYIVSGFSFPNVVCFNNETKIKYVCCKLFEEFYLPFFKIKQKID
ncbi:hypothetical protein RFI_15195 [Reticulomyxa filosa]|uniref:Uncharacterized protein n=1 Tax=Reticulomyxa filosa TaxID=46433 RepID=X6N7J6_RETFI|nr:hypothetical protein RFI_15195 [Reticulomyxa filosa]|eukprot:ETO22011.1 hypothetical protein RFI_15195 [Reticulomyxa filosa]